MSRWTLEYPSVLVLGDFNIHLDEAAKDLGPSMVGIQTLLHKLALALRSVPDPFQGVRTYYTGLEYLWDRLSPYEP